MNIRDEAESFLKLTNKIKISITILWKQEFQEIDIKFSNRF